MQMVPAIAITEATAHTRAGANATYWDKNGTLQTAAANTLRVTYDPNDLTKAPYALIEDAATNEILYSNDFAQAYWTKYQCGYAGATQNGARGPATMGTLTSTALGYAVLYLGYSPTGVHTMSAIFKAGTHNLALLAVDGVQSATFDLLSMTVTAGAGPNAKITPLGDGRALCELNFETPNGTPGGINAGMINGAVGSTMHISDLQFEAGRVASSRLLTAATSVTRPADVLGVGTFTACSLTENNTDDGPLWTPQTAYAVGQLVRRTSTHRVYECLVAHNSADTIYPEANTSGTTPKWLELRPTNKFTAFDSVIASQAVGTATGGGDASTLVYVLRPGKACDMAALFNLDATRVTISVVDSAGVLRYQRTENLRLRNCRSWSEWFFKPITRRRDFAFTGLPYYANATIVITVQKPGSVAKLGDLVVGRSEYLGEIQWEPEVRHVDYSRVVTDAFGVTKFVKRNNAKLLSCDLFVLNEEFDETNRLLGLYSSVALAFVGDERFQSTIVLGFVQDSRAVLKDPAGSFIYVQIQGLS